MQIDAALLRYRRGDRQASDAASDRPAAAADDDDDGAYVSCITLRSLPPLFPVSTWNVHVATLNGDDRTRHRIEALLRWSVVTIL